jgi:hypothetical protein
MLTAIRLRQRRADLPRAGSRPVAMTVTQVRQVRLAAVKMNLQQHNSTSVSIINHGFCYRQAPHCSRSNTLQSFAHTFRVKHIPIAGCAALSAHHHPRVRSLAAFRRRPPRTRHRHSRPASETPHITRHPCDQLIIEAAIATEWQWTPYRTPH